MFVSRLLFIGAAMAAPAPSKMIGRDLATFQNAFGAVSTAMTNFGTSIRTLNSAADVTSNLPDLTAKSNAVVSALSSGTDAVNGSPPLSLADSLNLISLSRTLVSNANTTIQDLISRKDFVTGAGQASFVVTQLQSIRSSGQTFIAAVVNKVPEAVKNTANTQASQVITILTNGITSFGGT